MTTVYMPSWCSRVNIGNSSDMLIQPNTAAYTHCATNKNSAPLKFCTAD